MRPIALAIALAPALPLLTSCTATDSDAPVDVEPVRPNILFVFTDDHASHAISAYGSTINRTPNIDRLASEGVLFANAFVGNSICAPARATVLTGLHSHASGVRDNHATFDGSQWTFPKALQAAGYETALIGKWHLKSDPTGFDYWEVLHGQGPYYNPALKTEQGSIQYSGYTTEIITDRALAWLEDGRSSEKPFLLMYQHKAPHRTWEPGPEYYDHYAETRVPEPPTLFDDGATRTSAFGAQEMTVREHLLDFDLKFTTREHLDDEQRAAWEAAYGPRNAAFEEAGLEGDELVRWKYQRYIKDYLRCIDAVDDQLGRVLDWLDEAGLAENTVVVYASDQGFYLGDHGWFDKRWMYEESLRMPLIVRWPALIEQGVEVGRVERRLVQNIDLASTFCELAGAELPPDRHGVSLVPLLRGEQPKGWRTSIYYHYFEFPGEHAVARHYGVRTERHKLINFYQNEEWELYDLERDPHELNNVAEAPAYAAVRKELGAELLRLREQFADDEAEPAETASLPDATEY